MVDSFLINDLYKQQSEGWTQHPPTWGGPVNWLVSFPWHVILQVSTNSRQEYGPWINSGKFMPYYGRSIVSNCLSFGKQKRPAFFILEYIIRICVSYTILPLYPWPLEQLCCGCVNALQFLRSHPWTQRYKAANKRCQAPVRSLYSSLGSSTSLR